MGNLYSELFLEDLDEIKKPSIIFLPLGTLEWHGAHLPLGSDLINAIEISKIISKKVGGVVLPPIFVGTNNFKIKKKRIILSGVDLQLNKKLVGSIYFLKPTLFYRLLESLIFQIKPQGFKKLVIIAGHSGAKQIEILDKIKNNFSTTNFKILVIYPLKMIGEKYGKRTRHAGYEETSLLWALRPDLVKKSKRTKYSNKDIIKLRGGDPRFRSSIKLGNQFLNYIIKDSVKMIKKF